MRASQTHTCFVNTDAGGANRQANRHADSKTGPIDRVIDRLVKQARVLLVLCFSSSFYEFVHEWLLSPEPEAGLEISAL